MMRIKVQQEQIDYANNLLKSCNFGKRGDGSKKYQNGDKEEQFVGILAQTILSDLLSKARPNGENETGDRGIDFIINGVKIDLKAMGRHCDVQSFFVNNLHAEQVGDYYQNDVYLFSSLNKNSNILTICGWVTKDEFSDRSHFKRPGTIRKNPKNSFPVEGKGLYEILNKDLNKFDSIEQFNQDMLALSTQIGA